MERKLPKEENKKIQFLLILALALIIVSAAIGYTLTLKASDKGSTGPVLATTYSGISAEDAFDLITQNKSPIKIIDIRSCKCNYNSGHLPNATWNINPISFYNSTEDLLIYSKNNEESIDFLEQLLNRTYSKLYYLEGGYKTWANAGYTIEK